VTTLCDYILCSFLDSLCVCRVSPYPEVTTARRHLIVLNWGCGELTTMDDRTMKMEKPLCTNCDPNSIPVEAMDPELIEKLKEMGVFDKLE
jgi:hypothetical protein